jgi:predicted alpha/beta hydrolase
MTMDHLRKIEVPCLVIAPSNDDQSCPMTAYEELSRKFRAGKLITIPGAQARGSAGARRFPPAQALAAIDAFIPGSDADPGRFSMRVGDDPITALRN